jgi:foldase protein PrsA
MKKWMLALTLAGGVIALSACNQSESDTVAESKAGNVTKDELYQSMKEQVGAQALQQLVYEKVLSDKYKVTDKELDAKVDELKEQYGENFEAVLTQSGLKDEAELREMMKVGMLQEKAGLESLTEKELKEAYENYKPEIKARHILVADEKVALEVKQKLDAGEKFEDVSNKYSTDEAAKASGGDLGWFGADAQMDPDFLEAAFKLKVNEISAPVKSQFGYHIIQVTEQKEKESYDKMKDKLKSSLLTTEKMNEVMQKLVKDAGVKISDKDLKNALDPQAAAPAQQ